MSAAIKVSRKYEEVAPQFNVGLRRFLAWLLWSGTERDLQMMTRFFVASVAVVITSLPVVVAEIPYAGQDVSSDLTTGHTGIGSTVDARISSILGKAKVNPWLLAPDTGQPVGCLSVSSRDLSRRVIPLAGTATT